MLPADWHFFCLKSELFCNYKQFDIKSPRESTSLVSSLWIIDIKLIKNYACFFIEELEATLCITNLETGERTGDQIKGITDKFAVPLSVDRFSIDFARAKDNIKRKQTRKMRGICLNYQKNK